MLGLRRATSRPPVVELPVPGLGQRVDLAKILACQALRDLSAHSDTVAVKDLAAFLQLDHSTASRLLTDAERDGYVVRSSDPSDRRRTTVALTPTGVQVADGAHAAQQAFLGLLLEDWSDDDVAALARSLDHLQRTLEQRANDFPALAAAACERVEAPAVS